MPHLHHKLWGQDQDGETLMRSWGYHARLIGRGTVRFWPDCE